MPTKESINFHGRWLDSGIRNIPSGPLVWAGLPRRAYTASVNGVVVATTRNSNTGLWSTRIPGWTWTVTPDMPAARFNLKEVEVKGFSSAVKAKEAVEAAFATLSDVKAKYVEKTGKSVK